MTAKPIFAIDPGNKLSAYCIYYPDTHRIGDFGKVENPVMRNLLKNSLQWEYDYAIEMIASYGMAVGKEVFNTCVWLGRFVEVVRNQSRPVELVYRKDVKMHLCNSMKAKDANIRQSIIDRFPPAGRGKVPQVGTKKYPGPLFGVSADVWAALGVALTHANKNKG